MFREQPTGAAQMKVFSLFGWRPCRLRKKQLFVVAVSAVAATMTPTSACYPQTADVGVAIRCVDNDDNPIEGAEIHLFQYNGEKGEDRQYVHFGPFTSDSQGRASCDQTLFSNDKGNYDRWIYARVRGRTVGLARCSKWTNRSAINPDGRVVMQPSCSVIGQVTVPDGFDPSTLTVHVQVMHVYTGSGMFDYESLPRHARFPGLDQALPEIFDRQPDKDGRVHLEDIPQQGRLYLVTDGPGLAQAQWKNEDRTFDKPIELTVAKEGVLTGNVRSPEGKPAVGMRMTARLSSGGKIRLSHLTSFHTVTDEGGTFAIGGLPETEFVLSVEDPEQRWVFRPREDLVVSPDENANLTLNLENGVVVTGHVFDPEGHPVEGAAFSALADSKVGPGLCHDVTDADGRYDLRLPAGTARLYFNSLPDGFAYPRPQIVKRLDVQPGQAAIENLNFTLQRKSDDG